MAEEKKKRCFIITPVGEPESVTRKNTDGLIDGIIRPIVEEHGYELVCPHSMSVCGSITHQVLQEILQDELVIANLTGLNPNVMYELAIRHATGKPIIIVCQNGTPLPFDIIDQRTLFYDDSISGVAKLRNGLKNMINEPLNIERIDNPIYTITESLGLRDALRTNKNGKALEFILNQIESLEKKVGFMEMNISRSVRNELNSIHRTILNTNVSNPASYQIIIENCLINSSTDRLVEIGANDSVQDVLDKVFFIIEPLVDAYKYMQTWVLRQADTGLYMIMYEVTSLVPAKYVFAENSRWQVVEWNKYKLSRSKHHKGYQNRRYYN